MIEIIDTHLHLWDLSEFSPPWLVEVPSLLRTFTIGDWAAAAGTSPDWRLKAAVYVEVDAPASDRARENDLVLAWIRQPTSPLAGAVVAADLGRANVEADLAPWLGDPGLKGVRHVLHTPASPPGRCLEPGFIANMRRLGALGLSFDACLRSGELDDLVRLAEAAPDTTIILDHCGNPGGQLMTSGPDHPELRAWRDGFRRLGACSNVVCKLSGLSPGASDAAAQRTFDVCVDVFGADRLLWASNYPVCDLGTPLRPWLECVLRAAASHGDAIVRKVFALNAARVYRLAG